MHVEEHYARLRNSPQLHVEEHHARLRRDVTMRLAQDRANPHDPSRPQGLITFHFLRIGHII